MLTGKWHSLVRGEQVATPFGSWVLLPEGHWGMSHMQLHCSIRKFDFDLKYIQWVSDYSNTNYSNTDYPNSRLSEQTNKMKLSCLVHVLCCSFAENLKTITTKQLCKKQGLKGYSLIQTNSHNRTVLRL